MARQRRGAPENAASSKRKRGRKPSSIGDPSKQADPATMIEAGNRPHETTLQGTELEDFGLDVLPVIQPHKA
jgi:hypothetical protein